MAYELRTLKAGAWAVSWRFDSPEMADHARQMLPDLARVAGADACEVVDLAPTYTNVDGALYVTLAAGPLAP